MKNKLVIALVFSTLWVSIACAQSSNDSSLNKQIELLETKISKVKSLPKEEQKQYFAVLSDVENRKNTLKSLLKTPLAKRDQIWNDEWLQNYSKASNKLDKIQIK